MARTELNIDGRPRGANALLFLSAVMTLVIVTLLVTAIALRLAISAMGGF